MYKLLGVHEQTKLLDLTGNGTAISGGAAANYPAVYAFDKIAHPWKSKQVGASAILASAYIGYDFGAVKLANGRQRYGITANHREHITTIRIKQSSTSTERVSKVRVERSDDGIQWYGVAVLTLPDDDMLNTLNFKQSVPSRYWRLRPLAFAGDACDSWGVVALEMHDYSVTDVNNIQDPILMENRDRDYSQTAISMKGYYELVTVNTYLAAMGIGSEMPVTYQIKLNFSSCVDSLGRPVVVGDIIELPSETQYTSSLRAVKRYLEVTEITWDTSTYTPGWMPLMLLVTAQPALASQETRDIFGDIAASVDSSGLFSNNDGNNTSYQDLSAIDQAIKAEANTKVPERGSEGSNTVREFTDEELAATAEKFPHLKDMNFNRTGLYVEDAIPQNGSPYTEGPELPANPSNGDYHRLVYAGTASNVPARLFRYSTTKQRWIYLETDRRAQYNTQKGMLNEYLSSTSKTPAGDIR